jgi:hypothetical protein
VSRQRAPWEIYAINQGTGSMADALGKKWHFCLDAGTPDLALGEAQRMAKAHPENAYLVKQGAIQRWVIWSGEVHPIPQGRAVAA